MTTRINATTWVTTPAHLGNATSWLPITANTPANIASRYKHTLYFHFSFGTFSLNFFPICLYYLLIPEERVLLLSGQISGPIVVFVHIHHAISLRHLSCLLSSWELCVSHWCNDPIPTHLFRPHSTRLHTDWLLSRLPIKSLS